jgi:hypothetical protein
MQSCKFGVGWKRRFPRKYRLLLAATLVFYLLFAEPEIGFGGKNGH